LTDLEAWRERTVHFGKELGDQSTGQRFGVVHPEELVTLQSDSVRNECRHRDGEIAASDAGEGERALLPVDDPRGFWSSGCRKWDIESARDTKFVARHAVAPDRLELHL
jgi:hypothetical protein